MRVHHGSAAPSSCLCRCCDPTVPFEEDPKDPTVWFLDSDYLEALFLMFKKVNGECVDGNYSSVHAAGGVAPSPGCLCRRCRSAL